MYVSLKFSNIFSIEKFPIYVQLLDIEDMCVSKRLYNAFK